MWKDDWSELEHEGLQFRWRLEEDENHGPPWKECDGHGDIRQVSNYYGHPDKNPGEVVLHRHRSEYWLYDYAGAIAKAKREWIGTPPQGKTMGQAAAEAVDADMKYLRGWLSDDWCWVGVVVEMVDEDGDRVGAPYAHAIWGIESDAHDFHLETAKELAGEIAVDVLEERKEAQYWAERDVVTE